MAAIEKVLGQTQQKQDYLLYYPLSCFLFLFGMFCFSFYYS